MFGSVKKISIILIELLLLSGYILIYIPVKLADIHTFIPKDELKLNIYETYSKLHHNPKENNQANNNKQNSIYRNNSVSPAAKVRPGDIVLVHGSTWIDHVIRIFTGSSYTHVAGIVQQNKAVDILPFSKTSYKNFWSYAGQADVYTCDNLTDEQRKKVVAYITGRLGTNYDYWLVLWQASRYSLHWMWPYDSRQNYLCSTLWADAYREVGVDLCPNVRYPTPGDLAQSGLLRKVESY